MSVLSHRKFSCHITFLSFLSPQSPPHRLPHHHCNFDKLHSWRRLQRRGQLSHSGPNPGQGWPKAVLARLRGLRRVMEVVSAVCRVGYETGRADPALPLLRFSRGTRQRLGLRAADSSAQDSRLVSRVLTCSAWNLLGGDGRPSPPLPASPDRNERTLRSAAAGRGFSKRVAFASGTTRSSSRSIQFPAGTSDDAASASLPTPRRVPRPSITGACRAARLVHAPSHRLPRSGRDLSGEAALFAQRSPPGIPRPSPTPGHATPRAPAPLAAC
ncbi:hypothetical protein MIND_01342300 [Mycena indigotica]|uniref:Uncharacterized protein n=1 Tax=Mycena indigotica TaxID=2126181 RepID=A0A8H6VU87_9AGAR|nr:uncharacterized protein MIND_01342300 [Mycena indigotica]KAF7290283.1 hypothetical protein MIND_01342300 [Mycena indigotica]